MENNEGKIFEVPKWEYTSVCWNGIENQKEIKELGKQGWEAVGFSRVAVGNTGSPQMVLKRQIGTVRLREVTKEQTPPAQNRGGGNGYDGY